MRRNQAGFTMVEMIIAIVIITFGLVALVGTVPSMIKISGIAREKQIALSAARSKLDEMRAVGFPDPGNPSATSFFNTYPDGTTFTALGLPQPSSGNQGTIRYLNEEQGSLFFSQPEARRRFDLGDASWVDFSLALDCDLDGFSRETENAHVAFRAFPVQVSVRWKNELGVDQAVELTTLLYRTKQ